MHSEKGLGLLVNQAARGRKIAGPAPEVARAAKRSPAFAARSGLSRKDRPQDAAGENVNIGSMNPADARQLAKSGEGQPAKLTTILLAGSNEEDYTVLSDILNASIWSMRWARTCREAGALVREESPCAVLCERDLPDGTWKDVLDAIEQAGHASCLIVVSHLADESLWAEVLNLGGFDVLAKPFDRQEVLWSLRGAEGRRTGREPTRPAHVLANDLQFRRGGP
jgi:CheY-like chemotaxis protein